MTGNNPIHTFFKLGYVEGLYVEEMDMDEVAKIIKSGDVEKFRNWVKQQEEDIIFIENPEESKSLLHCAVACSDSQKAKEMMTAILQYGIDINHLDKDGHTPLTDLLLQTKEQKKKWFSNNEDLKSLEEKIKFLIVHGATYSGEEYSKEQLKLIGECDKFKQDLQKQLKKELSTHIESNKKQSSIIEAIEVDGSCANIKLNSEGTELKISEFLQSNFCKNNGISSFSTFHNDEKGGLHGLLSSDGVRHYTVTDGSYNMTLNWYVKGEKHTITINIDKDGVEWEKVHGITDEILQANKDVRINGLSLFGAIQQGRGRQINTEREESMNETGDVLDRSRIRSQSADNSLTRDNVSDLGSECGSDVTAEDLEELEFDISKIEDNFKRDLPTVKEFDSDGNAIGSTIRRTNKRRRHSSLTDSGNYSEESPPPEKVMKLSLNDSNIDQKDNLELNGSDKLSNEQRDTRDIGQEAHPDKNMPSKPTAEIGNNTSGDAVYAELKSRFNQKRFGLNTTPENTVERQDWNKGSNQDSGYSSPTFKRTSEQSDNQVDPKKLNASLPSNEQVKTQPENKRPPKPTAEIGNNTSGDAVYAELKSRFNQKRFGLKPTPKKTVEGQAWNKGSNDDVQSKIEEGGHTKDSGDSSPTFNGTSEQSNNQVDPKKLNASLPSNEQVKTQPENNMSSKSTTEIGNNTSVNAVNEELENKFKKNGFGLNTIPENTVERQDWNKGSNQDSGYSSPTFKRTSEQSDNQVDPKQLNSELNNLLLSKKQVDKRNVGDDKDSQKLREEILEKRASLRKTKEGKKYLGEKSSQEVYKEPQHGKNESKKQPTYNFDTTRVSLANQLMRNAEEERLHGGIKDENESRVNSEESKGFNPKYASTPIKSSVVEKPNLQALREEILEKRASLRKTKEGKKYLGEKSSQEVYKEPQHGKNESKKQPTYDFDKNRVGLASEQQDAVNKFAKALANHTNKQGTPYVGTHTEKLEKARNKRPQSLGV